MKKILFLLMIGSSFTEIMAQSDPGLPGGDPDVPIDSGLFLLLIAGAIYGVRKINNRKAS